MQYVISVTQVSPREGAIQQHLQSVLACHQLNRNLRRYQSSLYAVPPIDLFSLNIGATND